MNAVGISFELDFAVDRQSKSRKSALWQIARRISCLRPGVSSEVVARYFLKREKLGSTAICSGVAAPHTLLDDVLSPLIVVTRLTEKVTFDSPDDTLIDLLLAVVGGKHDLKWLHSAMPRFVKLATNDGLLDQLRTARTVAEVANALQAVGLHCEATRSIVRET